LALFFAGSSNGRTPGSGPGSGGSNPPPAAKARQKKKDKKFYLHFVFFNAFYILSKSLNYFRIPIAVNIYQTID
jgi:hypothetical protein